MILQIHDDVDNDDDPPPWPDLIPDEYREKLESRKALGERLAAYSTELKALSAAERLEVRETLIRQNQLRQLFSCRANCKTIEELPQPIRDAAKAVFAFAFDLLIDFKIRDSHYRAIYESTRYKLCPFCGNEPFDAPTAPREDYDHYLPRDMYPFAGANLCNLVPAGKKCNMQYKRTTDPLLGANGVRRHVLNPYSGKYFELSLMATVVFGPGNVMGMDWQIDFEPESPESETWDAVFKIRERLKRDIFEPYWETWLGEFSGFAKQLSPQGGIDLSDALTRYCRYLSGRGLNDRAFMQLAFFRLVLDRVQGGNRRLIQILNTCAMWS